MFDSSHYAIEENMEKTRELVASRMRRAPLSRAEVGAIGGEEDGVIGAGEWRPLRVRADSGLGGFSAAGIGNIHGVYPPTGRG